MPGLRLHGLSSLEVGVSSSVVRERKEKRKSLKIKEDRGIDICISGWMDG